MSTILIAGANAPIAGEEVQISVRCRESGTAEFAVAVLPLPSDTSDPWLPLQDPPPPYAEGARTGIDFAIKLAKLSPSVQTIALALYASGGSTTLMALRNVSIEVGGYTVPVDNADLAVATIVFAELYRRGGTWKVRAKKEGVFDGIEELGRRLGVDITDQRKNETPPPTWEPSGRARNQADWTGSGSLIADRYLITNAHVVHGANQIYVSSFIGKSKAEAIIVDEKNDLALVRIAESFGRSELAFRATGVSLGETAITLGYPLHGLLGKGPQVTNGSVSNLLGPGDDASVMQITCPIQPGSSGGPVFDSSGLLFGVVTATLSNAQNVNFAIRTALVMPLMEAADLDIVRRDKAPAVEVSEVVRANAKFVWRVECFR